jgi:capsular polysaccharide biosynthesis protein
MRDRIQARFGGNGSGNCVYLRRGSTGAARAVANEAALLEHFLRRNWQVLDVATASVDDIQLAVCRADVVVGMEGSHLNHAQISLRRGASMVILVPQDRFNTSHIGRCRAHDVSPGMVVLTGSAKTGYHVDIEEVLRTIDLAVAFA